MKNSGCPDIDGASCRFLAKAIDDVKSLPEEADHLEKCEEEIAALRIKRDEEISKKQDEICVIGYDAERLDLLTTKASALVKYENLKNRSFIATVGKKCSYKGVLTYDIYWSWHW